MFIIRVAGVLAREIPGILVLLFYMSPAWVQLSPQQRSGTFFRGNKEFNDEYFNLFNFLRSSFLRSVIYQTDGIMESPCSPPNKGTLSHPPHNMSILAGATNVVVKDSQLIHHVSEESKGAGTQIHSC